MTYGDGLSSVNIKKLIKFHKKNKKLFTLTAVRPPARFGAIKIKGNYVSYFKEKNKCLTITLWVSIWEQPTQLLVFFIMEILRLLKTNSVIK